MTDINDRLRDRLSAFLDGELNPSDTDAVAILADRDAEIAAEIDGLREADAMARKAFDAMLDAPVPLDLARKIEAMSPAPEPVPANDPGPPRTSGLLRLVAGIALLLVGGGVGGYLGAEFAPAQQMASRGWLADVADYHRIYAAESRHLVEVAASESDHIESWLGNRTGVTFTTPDLSDQGLAYQGARMLVANGKPVAQLIYADADGGVYALCFQSSTGAPTDGFAAHSFDDIAMLSWRRAGAAFVVVGPQGSPKLQSVAEVAATEV